MTILDNECSCLIFFFIAFISEFQPWYFQLANFFFVNLKFEPPPPTPLLPNFEIPVIV